MYLDKTTGIYSCVDAHGSRQLSPNVKPLVPYWQNAYGYEIGYIDNNECGYTTKNKHEGFGDQPITPPLFPIPSPGQTLAPLKPEPQILPGPVTSA